MTDAVRWARAPLIVTVAAGGVLALVSIAFTVVTGAGWRAFVDSYTLTNLVIGIGFLGSGAVIAWFGTRNLIGPMFLVCGIGHLMTAAAVMLLLFAIRAGWPVPAVRALATVSMGAWQAGLPGLFPVALLMFPTGRLPSRRWLPVACLLWVSGGYQLVSGLLSDAYYWDHPQATTILSAGLTVSGPLDDAMGYLNSALWVAVIVALVRRYVRGGERTRRRLLWLILALLAGLLINSQRWLTGDGPILFLLSFTLFPIAIGIAIVRYELFDIRLVLSRALLYGLTVSVVVAVYAGLVAAFSLLVPESAERGVAIGSSIVVAICFTPLRLALQRLIDRVFYGTRSDPAATASRIGERLRHDDDLTDVLDRTRAALRLPWLVLHGPTGAELAAAGVPDGSPSSEIPLGYRGTPVGGLVVGLRRGEGRLHDSDRRALDLIATPLSVALHATALSEQVRQARIATIEAGAAERVRLQRELHDGLGPMLASVTFLADAASNLIRSDTDEAERLLGEVRADLRTALDSVRDVVYGLRPIELDDLGLVGALSQKVAGLSGEARRGIAVELDAPWSLPTLSPAVELAAYRIANEALANVIRHSDGRRCVISVSADRDLVVTVEDDGDPPSSWSPGVGLRSIRDRAEEIGGSATAGPTANGWEVRARLPLPVN
ncbi:sensor histidine kinase [Microbispora sp. NEAU-D428]|uniref:sensor histidine kinase n=1 Tax=Microbispora sitophila TaxID=2771537 RepID=UPI001867F55F|nr:sensor histidine kinase [Microbispora sitophila]MBE3011183.1 sensor histidine kinase [Microbispora sitophila]